MVRPLMASPPTHLDALSEHLAVRLQLQDLQRREREASLRRQQEANDAMMAAATISEHWQDEEQPQQRRRQPAQHREEPAERAARIKADLIWFSGVDMSLWFLCIILYGFGTGLDTILSVAGFAGPGMAALTAMQYDWRLAAMHMLCSVGTLAVRAVLVPITTGNFLFGTSAVALALSSLHQTLIGARWSRLLWTHGTSLKAHRRASTYEQRRSASQHLAEDTATTELELHEGVPISPGARAFGDSEDAVAVGVPVGRASYT